MAKLNEKKSERELERKIGAICWRNNIKMF